MNEPLQEATLVLYQHINDEIKELRNERWRLTVYFTSLAVGIMIFSKETQLLGEFICIFKISVKIVLGLSIIIYSWLLIRNNKYLNNSRTIRKHLEKRFKLDKLYHSGERFNILPPVWFYKPLSKYFEIFDLTIPMLVLTVGCQLLAIIVT